MYIAKKQFGWTLERIGTYFGGKNHASVIYSIRKFEESLQNDPDLQQQVNQYS
ncbi:MAG: hypothetical protein H6765_07515 [Candidatus Peribacteria bacterium]|nr:MAG: hypothetical protein H6765_07515 [Candidatus Peribacteria bacterium]